jgi:hypothetical protein
VEGYKKKPYSIVTPYIAKQTSVLCHPKYLEAKVLTNNPWIWCGHFSNLQLTETIALCYSEEKMKSHMIKLFLQELLQPRNSLECNPLNTPFLRIECAPFYAYTSEIWGIIFHSLKISKHYFLERRRGLAKSVANFTGSVTYLHTKLFFPKIPFFKSGVLLKLQEILI